MNANNSYAIAANRKAITALTGKLDTKKDLSNTSIETAKDIVAGAVFGGLAGAFIGRPAALTGLGVTFAGHYFGSSALSSFGLSMMTMGGYKLAQGAFNGVEGLDGAKERVKEFFGNWKHNLYLDKLKAKKKETSSEETNGLGNVQYFKYPSNGELDMSGLDNIEQQIMRSGDKFEQKRQFAGADEEVFSGTEDKIY